MGAPVFPELELDAVMGDGRAGDLGEDGSSSELSGLATKSPGATRFLAPWGRRAGGVDVDAWLEKDGRRRLSDMPDHGSGWEGKWMFRDGGGDA